MDERTTSSEPPTDGGERRLEINPMRESRPAADARRCRQRVRPARNAGIANNNEMTWSPPGASKGQSQSRPQTTPINRRMRLIPSGRPNVQDNRAGS